MMNDKISILYFNSGKEDFVGNLKSEPSTGNVKFVKESITQDEFVCLLDEASADTILLVDGNRVPLTSLNAVCQNYERKNKGKNIGYYSLKKHSLIFGCIRNIWGSDRAITTSPILIGSRSEFQKAYGGNDLHPNVLSAVGYSLQKSVGVKFQRLEEGMTVKKECPFPVNRWDLFLNYSFRLPLRSIFSGDFFRKIFSPSGKVLRDMVCRMLLILFACFAFVYMPYVSRDYGVTGDEFVDHRHAGYVLDYFMKGDKAALDQPKTALHLYGNSLQVVAAAIARTFHIDSYYELRHFICALCGAVGVLFAGLMGLRWGGGLCGLLSALLMFFTPRYFGHSMNNLKDIPFAVGYLMSVYYTIRLFDYYPTFRIRDVLGLALGIGLALGTRSGGLILYPMIFMYGGLYYISVYGIREFYKFGKYFDAVKRILSVLFVAGLVGYLLSIVLWPYALQKPFTNVVVSLERFTHFNIGLRTIFDGKQMMSNMLPWQYAPKYLLIGMPLVTISGFIGYMIYLLFRRKEFSLMAYFLLFSAIFPIFWVIYKNSNLYGGIRHLLFVMPMMVIVSARFWSLLMTLWNNNKLKIVFVLVFSGLFCLPVVHSIRNHPNEYGYFNELAGGMKGAYGNYETDYYFNSLKQSAGWFKKNILPDLPKDRKTVIVSQLPDALNYYFRNDTNIKVIYSRYYEKYSKDWDYAIFANSYINRFQLLNNLFPPEGFVYAPMVDGYPMSFVLKRQTKMELEGFELEKAGKYQEALEVFREYTKRYRCSEEIWGRMAKLYFLTGALNEADVCADKSLMLHPSLNEALYMSGMINIQRKDLNKAFKATERMLAENVSSADAYYLRALVYFNGKKYQEAIQDINKTLAYRQDYDRALILAGDIMRICEQYDQAIKIYSQVLSKHKDINTIISLAETYCRMGHYAETEKLLNEINRNKPGYLPFYKVVARMYIQQNKFKEAELVLNQISQVQQEAELYVLWALYYEKQNNKPEMTAMIAKALAVDADNWEAIKLKRKS
ncbi:MAG: CDC27 family protein [Odoribacter sp.]